MCFICIQQRLTAPGLVVIRSQVGRSSSSAPISIKSSPSLSELLLRRISFFSREQSCYIAERAFVKIKSDCLPAASPDTVQFILLRVPTFLFFFDLGNCDAIIIFIIFLPFFCTTDEANF